MKMIELTQGMVALVDDEDFERVNQHKWCAKKAWGSSGCDTFYAERCVFVDGKKIHIRMHWLIMGGKWVDHVDGNGLNNQKLNIRFCTSQQNSMNRRPYKETSSKLKGVHYYKSKNNWTASIFFNGKKNHLGYFETEKEAAVVYDKKASEYFGEFAYLNFK